MHPLPRLRLVGARACAVAAVATVFGVIGHVHAGGGDPYLMPALGLWLVASALSAAFLVREAGWLRIAALLLGEQLVVHVGLMRLADPAPMPAMGGMPGMSGMPAMSQMSVLPSPSMVLGHALAAAVAGLWLWRGERALWALLTLVFERVRTSWLRVDPLGRLPEVAITVMLRPSWGLRIAREVPRRGPPCLMAL